VANDDYISPHSLNAVGEQPVKTPKYREIPTDDPYHLHLEQDGWEIQYPHHTWINARESYALGRDSLENMLQYVTETNPPPGPPIPVYKQQVPERKPLCGRGVGLSVLAWSVFTGMYIPYGEHGHYQLTLFVVINVLWLAITWALRRVR
jgi:hypothetical protein